jgi:carbon-monoxide dehydrogenase medium subunit
MKDAESFLIGKEVTDDVIEEAARMAADAITPITDQRATAGYRKEMVYVGLKHMIREAADKIK